MPLDDDLGEAALAQLDPVDDIHASAAYRAQLVRVLTERVVRSAREGTMTEQLHDVRLSVNGATHAIRVPARRLLSDALRHDLGLTGTHVGCEHGVCGACTVLLDGEPGACLPDVRGLRRRTTRSPPSRGSPRPTARSGPVQQAFAECHGLQCGFCTPGFLTTITAGLRDESRRPRTRRPGR